MIMGFLLRCRYWSVLQLAVIIACNQGKVSSERAQGCVWSQLSLRCPTMKVIQITAVVLGNSACRGASCCIKYSDCTRDANANHRADVHHRCNNRQSCTVGVLREKITCGYWGTWGNNDFERITYNCIADRRNDTMKYSTYDDAMEDNNSTDFESEIAQGCAGSQLSLRCEEMTIIEIKHVVLGDLNGDGTVCKISDSNSYCTQIANADHTMDVHRRCNGQRNCTVHVIQEDIICGFNNRSSASDFERITYNCLDDTQSYGTEKAQGCVSSQLNLRCNETKIIKVMHVFLGVSNGVGTICNINGIKCTQIANANHTMDVHHRCDGQSNCTVDVINETINCGTLNSRSNNDFELIAYNCLNDSRNSLTSTDGTITVKTISYNTEAVSATDEPNSQELTLVAVIIFSIILLAIIVAVVIMHRRKKKRQDKSSNVVEKSDRNEANNVNDSRGPSSTKNVGSSASIFRNDNSKDVKKSLNCKAKNLETQASEYCELEGMATVRIQSDGDYEELNQGRNYEPLILYEQLQTPLSGTFVKS